MFCQPETSLFQTDDIKCTNFCFNYYCIFLLHLNELFFETFISILVFYLMHFNKMLSSWHSHMYPEECTELRFSKTGVIGPLTTLLTGKTIEIIYDVRNCISLIHAQI